MFKKDELGTDVANIGLLIGLLTDEGNDNVSVNTDWFSDPISELETIPKRVKELLDVLNSLVNPVDGTEYTLDSGESWYSIFGGWDDCPTGLCLITPKTGATSGVISLGVFSQFEMDDLTISMYARLPLFYVEETKDPQFVLASDLSQYKYLNVELDVYSSEPVQVGSDAAFNMMAVAAKAEFSDNFTTDFSLSFYQDFDPKTGDKTELPAASTDTIIGRIGELVVQGNHWLNGYIGSAPLTVGDILSATGLVTATTSSSGTTSYSFDLDTFNALSKDPTQVFENFLISLLTKMLDELAATKTLLVPIFGGGMYATKDAAANTYGLRLSIPDYALTSSTSTRPQIVVQLGKWFTDETDDDNWVQQTSGQQFDPGIDIFFLKYDGQTLSTTAYIELVSLGIDITGQGDKPLIDIGGYTLEGAEIRTYLAPPNGDGWKYGFGARLDDVGFPVGSSLNDFESGSGANPVAKNLVASGEQEQDDSDTKDAVNPVFSAEAAWINGHTPILEVFNPQGQKTDLIWFPIQRRLGPINCQKIGLKITDAPELDILFDGSVSLSALSIYLDQLSVDIPLHTAGDISTYGLDLQGLDVSFNNGGVELSGGFIKTTDDAGDIAYSGEALIKYEELAIGALGSYSYLEKDKATSLFIFAWVNYPLGGPSFFFVTGLAAGFGYNRTLKIPAQDQVQDFPLVAALADPNYMGADPNAGDALEKLASWIPAQRGEYWLAVGIQFTTFDIINTNALLIVEFGNELVVAVLGLSTLKQPQIGTPYVYAELEIEVVFRPQQGELKASAVLASSSYVITPDAHLTGGFAFYAWFGSSEHAGEFVFTIGGYHPAFNAPSYYPQESRVGINWQISDNLALTGDAYFAITPMAMMGGGGLSLTFHDGNLKAWFKAQADAIMFWKPFYLIVDASVSIGVSYRIHFLFVDKTLSVELSADFHFHGPPIGGTVHVEWYIISFTISFGEEEQIPSDIGWDEFSTMLPSKTSKKQDNAAAAQFALTADADDDTTTTSAYLHINVNKDGLKRQQTVNGETLWLVRPGRCTFTIESAIPATEIVIKSHDGDLPTVTGNQVGVRRLNGGISKDDYSATQTIAILAFGEDGNISDIEKCILPVEASDTGSGCDVNPTGQTLHDVSHWAYPAVTQDLPQAMWGDPVSSGQDPDINPADGGKPTTECTTGVAMSPEAPALECSPEMEIQTVFGDSPVNPDDEYRLPVSQTEQPADNVPQDDVSSFTDIKTINDEAVVAKRGQLFAALQTLGVNGWTNEALPQMAADPSQCFADEPMEGSPVSVSLVASKPPLKSRKDKIHDKSKRKL